MTGEAGVDEPGSGVREQAEPAQGGLALETTGDVVGERDHLVGGTKHELTRMQDERLVALGLDQPREVGLLDAGIDVRVAVILEDPEPAVEPHVEARWLDHGLVVRLEADPALGEFGLDVAVGKQHPPRLSGHGVTWRRDVPQATARATSGRYRPDVALLHPDPGHTALRRGIRAAIVLEIAVAITLLGMNSPQAALFAAFGAVGLLLTADFAGTWQRRLAAYLAMGAAGAVIITIGWAAAQNPVAQVIVTAVVAFVLAFAPVMRGMLAAAAPGLLVVFVVAVTFGGTTADLPSYLAGWAIAVVLSTAAGVVLLPRDRRLIIRDALCGALRAAADLVDSIWVAPDAGSRERNQARLDDAVDHLNKTYVGQPFRPAGMTARDRALSLLVDEVNTARILLGTDPDDMAADPGEAIGTPALAQSMREALVAIADSLTEQGSPPTAQPLDAARLVHHQRTEEWVLERSRAGDDTATLARSVRDGHLVRIAALVSEQLVELARQSLGAEVETLPDLPALPERSWASIVRAETSLGSSWFRSALRSGVGLGIAIFIVQEFGVSHGFWVLLGVLSVLRTDAASTRKFAWQAVVGTVLGVVLAVLILAVTDPYEILLWVLMPLVVVICAWGPVALGYISGQAAFSAFVMIVLGIIDWPPDLSLGLVRVENVAIGAVVAVIVGLILWPGGAAKLLHKAVAVALRETSSYLTLTVNSLTRHIPATTLQVQETLAIDSSLRASETHDIAVMQGGTAVTDSRQWARLTNATTLMLDVSRIVRTYSAQLPVLEHSPQLSALVEQSAALSADVWTVVADDLERDGRPGAVALRPDDHPDPLPARIENAAGAHAFVLALWTADWVDNADRLAFASPPEGTP